MQKCFGAKCAGNTEDEYQGASTHVIPLAKTCFTATSPDVGHWSRTGDLEHRSRLKSKALLPS